MGTLHPSPCVALLLSLWVFALLVLAWGAWRPRERPTWLRVRLYGKRRTGRVAGCVTCHCEWDMRSARDTPLDDLRAMGRKLDCINR